MITIGYGAKALPIITKIGFLHYKYPYDRIEFYNVLLEEIKTKVKLQNLKLFLLVNPYILKTSIYFLNNKLNIL